MQMLPYLLFTLSPGHETDTVLFIVTYGVVILGPFDHITEEKEEELI